MSLTDLLAALGYTTEPGNYGRKRVVDASGVTVLEGTAHDVTHWLRSRGDIVEACITAQRGDYCSYCAEFAQ